MISGKLFLLQIFAEMGKQEDEAVRLSMKDLEEWIETHHCRTGSTLLTKWGFPPDYTQIALHHGNPYPASGSRELMAVYAANDRRVGRLFVPCRERGQGGGERDHPEAAPAAGHDL